jgi:Glycosyltransferase family 87
MSPTRAPGSARRRRLVAPALVALAAANLLAQLSWALDAPPKTDYLPFATGTRVLAAQPSCTYCMDAQASQQAAILGYTPTAGFPKPFVNPPLVALLLRPLAALPLRSGLLVLLVVLLAALAAAALLLARLLPAEWPAWRRILLATAALASLPAATGLALAQWGPLLVLAALGALAALRSGRPLAAGLLLSVLLVKPQTVWLVLPLLAAAGSWRVLLGFAAGSSGWLLSGVALVGPAQMAQWPRLVLEKHVDEATRTAGLPGLAGDVFGGGRAAFVAAVVLAAAVVVGTVALRGRLRGRPEVAVGLGIALSLLCAPHVFPDDLMLLAVTAAVWAPLAPWGALGTMISLSVAYQLDGWLPGGLAHLTPLAVVGVVVGAALALLGRRASCFGGQRSAVSASATTLPGATVPLGQRLGAR